jgi:hypothetical protein
MREGYEKLEFAASRCAAWVRSAIGQRPALRLLKKSDIAFPIAASFAQATNGGGPRVKQQ